MNQPLSLSKEDAKRALISYHFESLDRIENVFDKFRSIQFDPISPIGCNHDLVLLSRLQNYKIGDWQIYAYGERKIFDGWDKQASLVPFEGWNSRRIFYDAHRKWFEDRVLNVHKEETRIVLKELESKGAMRPKDFELKLRRDEWQGSWFGPNVVKNILRALWHTGEIMTSNRIKGQHVYDLTHNVLPKEFHNLPKLDDSESKVELALDRHLAMGMVRPTSNPEIWSNQTLNPVKKSLIQELVGRKEIVPIIVEDVHFHVPQRFVEALDSPDVSKHVTFLAPLDPFMWDRKMIAHLFDFDYIWEIYTPESKRKWGYYVLPVRYGNDLVAKIEFYARNGTLEIRNWHLEKEVDSEFSEEFKLALKKLMDYCSCSQISFIGSGTSIGEWFQP